MGDTFVKANHNLYAGQVVKLANLVGGEGLEENVPYYVLSSGLTSTNFKLSETDGGSPITFTTDITSGSVVGYDTYEVADDGVMDPPTTPPTPAAPTVSSAAVAGSSGSLVELRIAQAAAISLRQSARFEGAGVFTGTATPAFTAIAGNLLIGTASSRDAHGGLNWPTGWLPIKDAVGVDLTDPTGDHNTEVRYKVSDGTETDLTVACRSPAEFVVTIFEFSTNGYEWEPVFAGNAATTVASNPNVWPEVALPVSKGIEVLHFAIRSSQAFGDNVLPASFTTTYDNVPLAERTYVGYRVISENAPPYNYTNPDTFAKLGSYVIVAFARASEPAISMEVQLTREFSGATPVWTDANIINLPAGHRNIAHRVSGNTQYAVRLRRADVYGNFSAWSSSTTHTTAAGSDSTTATDHAAALDPHTQYRLEADDHSHQTSGAQAGQLDHGAALTGLGDDDHPQYILKSLVDAKGDILTGTANDTPARLPVGTDGQVLTADSTQATGLKWGAGAAGAPSTVDYLVGTASPDLSAEIVVGTTPGGELGGTWASPTVDATHSGSAHVLLTANTPAAVGTAGAVGIGTASAKDDHVHAHEAAHIEHDTIWDAAGDLAVGSGADTAARLAKGSAGATLAMFNGAVTWNAGTSFPASPATNDRYYRTDHSREYFYNGTRWLSVQLFEMPMNVMNATLTALTATTADHGRVVAPALSGGSDIWLVDLNAGCFVAGGGTALSASHKWVANLHSFHGNAINTSLGNLSIDSGASTTYRNITAAINTLMNNGTAKALLSLTWTKTGTPGNLTPYMSITYRIVAT